MLRVRRVVPETASKAFADFCRVVEGRTSEFWAITAKTLDVRPEVVEHGMNILKHGIKRNTKSLGHDLMQGLPKACQGLEQLITRMTACGVWPQFLFKGVETGAFLLSAHVSRAFNHLYKLAATMKASAFQPKANAVGDFSTQINHARLAAGALDSLESVFKRLLDVDESVGSKQAIETLVCSWKEGKSDAMAKVTVP